jgi:flagellar biosynthesis protein
VKKQPERKGAVALKYDPEQSAAPKVVASGKGEVANRIIETAREHDVPIYQDPDLMELLLALDTGVDIPENLYVAVAEILSFVYRMNGSTALADGAKLASAD